MQPGQNISPQLNEGQLARPVQLNKRQLRQKIQSRNDFVMLFGFERELISPIFFAPKAFDNMALYIPSSQWRKNAFEAISHPYKCGPAKN